MTATCLMVTRQSGFKKNANVYLLSSPSLASLKTPSCLFWCTFKKKLMFEFFLLNIRATTFACCNSKKGAVIVKHWVPLPIFKYATDCAQLDRSGRVCVRACVPATLFCTSHPQRVLPPLPPPPAEFCSRRVTL